MLSKKATYALKALLVLAQEQDKGPILISELAESESIPKKFLEQILLDLKHHGILQSKKGKGGGYILGKNPNTITFGQVIRLIDGPLAPVPCVSETAYQRCEGCKDEAICGVRIVMKAVRDAIATVVDGVSLADTLRDVHRANMSKQRKRKRQAMALPVR